MDINAMRAIDGRGLSGTLLHKTSPKFYTQELQQDAFTPSFRASTTENNKTASNMVAGVGLLLAGTGLAWWLFPENATKIKH